MNCLVVGKGAIPSSRNGARTVPCRLPDASRCARSSRGAGCKRRTFRPSVRWRSRAASAFRHVLQQLLQHHQPASCTDPLLGQPSLPDIILTDTKQFSSTSSRVIRSQLRCDPDARRAAAHKTFIYRRRRHPLRESARQCLCGCVPPSNLRYWRGRWRRPCVECTIYSDTRADSVISAKQLYIQNEGLSEIFRETG